MKTQRKIIGLVILMLCICGGATGVFYRASEAAPAATVIIPRDKNPVNFHALDSALTLLRDGDLVLRTGADATSYMLRMMNLTDKTYSHCGIVMVEGGHPFVYHSIGGEDNPDERLRRDSVTTFFSPLSNERLGIVRLDLKEAQIESLHKVVLDYHRRKLKFDMDFDLATDDKLYCAEFVYKAVREAVKDTGYFPTTHFMKRHYVGVDNLYRSPHAHLICDIRYK